MGLVVLEDMRCLASVGHAYLSGGFTVDSRSCIGARGAKMGGWPVEENDGRAILHATLMLAHVFGTDA